MNLIFLQDENIGCNYHAYGTACILIRVGNGTGWDGMRFTNPSPIPYIQMR